MRRPLTGDRVRWWLAGRVPISRAFILGVSLFAVSGLTWLPAAVSGTLLIAGVGLLVWDRSAQRRLRNER